MTDIIEVKLRPLDTRPNNLVQALWPLSVRTLTTLWKYFRTVFTYMRHLAGILILFIYILQFIS